MEPYCENIEKLTLRNSLYRRVLYTTSNFQLVVMALEPQEEIGMEVHSHTTQFIRVEKGLGIAEIGSEGFALDDGVCVVVPPGVYHNIRNVSSTEPLKLYTIYTPPEHPPNLKEIVKR